MAVNTNIRYRADWTSQEGDRYRIDICDTDYSGGAADLEVGEDGFTLSYESDNNITSRILASKCKINCMVNDASFDALITDITNAQENRFFLIISIYESIVYRKIWAGNILVDLVSYDDFAHPYFFQITAIDGISRLKDIDYPTSWEVSEIFLDYLKNSLSNLPILQFWNSAEQALRTSVNYYNSKMFVTSPSATLDPVAVTKVLNNAFRDVDSKGNAVSKSYFDVLQQMCIRWNAVFFLADGVFYFVQISELANSTMTYRNYTKAASYIDTSQNVSTRITNFLRTEGVYTFFRPLLKTKLTYKYKQYMGQTNRLPDQSDYSVSIDIGMMAGGNGETLIVSGNVDLTMTDSGSTIENHRWNFKMKIQVGNYYLHRDSVYNEWTTDSTARVDIFSAFHNDYNYTDTIAISFTSPEVPVVEVASFEFDFIEYSDGINPITIPITAFGTFSCRSFSILQTGGDGTDEVMSINSSTGSTSEKKIPEILTGDGASEQSDGRLIIQDTTGAWVNSAKNWTKNGVGTAKFINQLLADDVLSLQQSARKIFTGTIAKKIIWPYNSIEIGGSVFVLANGNFNANRKEWVGQFNEIKLT